MTIKVTMTVLSSVMLSAIMTTQVLAETPKTAAHANMTCEEFVALDDVVKPKVVYWTEGLNKKGKTVDSVVDVDETDKLVPVLVTECKETPKLSLLQKVKTHSASVQKPTPKSAAMTKSAAIQKPGNMTCKEFLALDDAVKPKIVYWAEGFNKKGKPVDSVVDVDETDKLVPVLVTECTETPKLSFWQKIKAHF